MLRFEAIKEEVYILPFVLLAANVIISECVTRSNFFLRYINKSLLLYFEFVVPNVTDIFQK